MVKRYGVYCVYYNFELKLIPLILTKVAKKLFTLQDKYLNIMKNTFISFLLVLFVSVFAASAQNSGRKVQVAGIAFYNWENLFDTIPNNPEGRDIEFTPKGQIGRAHV